MWWSETESGVAWSSNFVLPSSLVSFLDIAQTIAEGEGLLCRCKGLVTVVAVAVDRGSGIVTLCPTTEVPADGESPKGK